MLYGGSKTRDVSIPHRYDKNMGPNKGKIRYIILFQFLIGTIKTDKEENGITQLSLFQFLIGTIKTRIDLYRNNNS